MKLTDTQLIVLSTASQRDDRAAELPPKLKGGAAHRVVSKLLDFGLLEELQARGGLPAWRPDDEDRPVALRITKRGLGAIRVGDEEELPSPPRPSSRRAKGGKDAWRSPRAQRKAKGGLEGRQRSKQATVVEMLRARHGASISAIMERTGWQPHSVRGFLTAMVRKKLGLELRSDRAGSERVYRIIEA